MVVLERGSKIAYHHKRWSHENITGWWWLEHDFYFPIYWGIIIPIDWYVSEGMKPPTRLVWIVGETLKTLAGFHSASANMHKQKSFVRTNLKLECCKESHGWQSCSSHLSDFWRPSLTDLTFWADYWTNTICNDIYIYTPFVTNMFIYVHQRFLTTPYSIKQEREQKRVHLEVSPGWVSMWGSCRWDSLW